MGNEKEREVRSAFGVIAPSLKPSGKPKTKAGVSTHKARAKWFGSSTAWPFREPDIERLVRSRRRMRRTFEAHATAEEWQPVGPTNIGGRMTCVVCHPTDADRIWVGAAGGGVWTSKDAGRTWRSRWKKQETLNVGSLAIDPNDPTLLYCGTGEANLSADSYPGVGLYRSTNSGASWRLIARSKNTGIPIRIGTIAVDPFDSNHILLGGIGHRLPGEPASHVGGVYGSKDGGLTWTRFTFVGTSDHWCHAVLFHPTLPGVIYAAVTEQGMRSGIWRSENGGGTWTHLQTGLPSPERIERTSLAISASNPNVLYAQCADSNSRVLGVFRTDDGGDSWNAVHGTSFHYKRWIGTSFEMEFEVQMSYNSTIAVHPMDPEIVICAGVDLHRSDDGGATWVNVTQWERNHGDPQYAHADHHALLFAGADPDRVYDMNDGGMDVSQDAGVTWENRSDGLAVTMFYDLDVAQSNGDYFGGGAQDNGTPITTTGAPDECFDVTGGDGGWLVFDPRDENHIYASIYNFNIFRWPPSGWKDVSPPALPWEKEDMWMVFIAMHPSDSRTVFTGSRRVWRTRDDGDSWDAVSGFFGGRITCIEICRANPSRVYAGTDRGEFFRSDDGGDSWSGNLASTVLPGVALTRIVSSPQDEDLVLLTLGNVKNSHVFRSRDGAHTWTDVDGGRLPDVPHRSLAIPTHFAGEVYVASDVGVLFSSDEGENWQNLTLNLPNVSVIDVVYHDAENTLTAATYGRSHWRLKIR